MFIAPKPLTIGYVLSQFRLIADMTGDNTTQSRIDAMRRLLCDGSDVECKYLVRLFLAKNRLGI